MSAYTEEMARLRAANPVPVESDRGLTPGATATLTRILQEPIDARSPRERSRAGRLGRRIVTPSSRGLIVVLAAAVTAGGAAFAATDPFGWWSANPTYAKYGSNPAVHVRTPSAREIACASSGGVLRCSPASTELPSGVLLVNGHRSRAQPYTLIDAIRPPARGFTRRALLAFVASGRAARAISAAQAARFRADIAAVPDSFFTEFERSTRYGTYGNGAGTHSGLTLVPPRGIPSLVVCEPAGQRLRCQNLNGDEHAPIGAGVYGATPTRTWRYERVPPENSGLPPGLSFTPAEYRVLGDLLRLGAAGHTSGSATAKAIPAPPPQHHHQHPG